MIMNKINKISKNFSNLVGVILVFLIVLSISSVFVAGDKLHSFQQKNELIEVDGHKIVALDVTTNDECLMTIDGEVFMIKEKKKKGTSEIEVYVKQAIAIRTTNKLSIYCDTLIDVIVPRVVETNEFDVVEDKIEETQVTINDEDGIDKDQTVEIGDVNEIENNLEDNNQEKQSFFSRFFSFIKQLFS